MPHSEKHVYVEINQEAVHIYMELLTEVDSKLFAKCKSGRYCLHRCRQVIRVVMVLRPCGHDYDVRRVTYEATESGRS